MTGPAASSRTTNSAADVRDIDLSIVHFLSGPVGVEGAEPGDLLVVDFLDIGAFPHNAWGFNGFFSKKNGGGFLTDHFPQAQKSIWDIHGMFTSSRHVPGVSFAGLIHPGLIGCLPDPKLLETWNQRETGLIATNPNARAAAGQRPVRADRAHGPPEGRREGRRRRNRRAHRAAARAWRQLRHQGPVARRAGVLPGLCPGRRSLDGRPAFQPGRRRDHLLRRDRNARLDPSEGRTDQGRHGEVRHQEPDLQAERHQADLQRLSDFRGHLGRRSRRAALPRRQRRLSAGLPERDRIPEEVRLFRAPRPTRSSAPRRCRAISAASSISPTPAPRSGCRPRSSTSTSIRAPTDPAAASRAASTCRSRRISKGATMPSTTTSAPTAVRSPRCGRWRSSRRRTPARNAAPRRRARCSSRRRCQASTRPAAPPSQPTSAAQTRPPAAPAIRPAAAAARAAPARRSEPTRQALRERSPVSVPGCWATDRDIGRATRVARPTRFNGPETHAGSVAGGISSIGPSSSPYGLNRLMASTEHRRAFDRQDRFPRLRGRAGLTRQFRGKFLEESQDAAPIVRAAEQIHAEGDLPLVRAHRKLEIRFILYRAAQERVTGA